MTLNKKSKSKFNYLGTKKVFFLVFSILFCSQLIFSSLSSRVVAAGTQTSYETTSARGGGTIICNFKAGTVDFDDNTPGIEVNYSDNPITISNDDPSEYSERTLGRTAWEQDRGEEHSTTKNHDIPSSNQDAYQNPSTVNAIFGGDNNATKIEDESMADTSDDFRCAWSAYLEQSPTNKLEFKGRVGIQCQNDAIFTVADFDPSGTSFTAKLNKLTKPGDCGATASTNTDFIVTLVSGMNRDILGDPATNNTPHCSSPYSRNCWGLPDENGGQVYICADGFYLPAPANPANCPTPGENPPPESTLLPIDQYTKFFWIDAGHIGRGRVINATSPTGTNYTKDEIIETYSVIGAGGGDEKSYKLTDTLIADRKDLLKLDEGKSFDNATCTPKIIIDSGWSFDENPFNKGLSNLNPLINWLTKTKKISTFVDYQKSGTGCASIQPIPQGIEGSEILRSENSRILFEYYKDSGFAQILYPDLDGNEKALGNPFKLVGDGATQTFDMDPQPCHAKETRIIPVNIGSKNFKTGEGITDKLVFDVTMTAVRSCAAADTTFEQKQDISFRVRYKGTGTAPSINVPGQGDGTTKAPDPTCESEGGVTAWVICPFINMASNGIDWIEKEIQGYLYVDGNFLTQAELKTAWTNIRNIAYALLVPIMLVMVIGTALGFNFVSAYTVKRALPRMIAAVMFITFSWYICGYLINFFNVVGAGISGLMEGPFAAKYGGKLTLAGLFETSGANSVATAFESLAFGVALTAGAIALIFFFLPTFLLSIAVGWLVLTVRQVLIVALVMLAPVAILAWIFPGNDKLWKLWKGSFTKLLIMYPLIMMLISAGHVMAFITNSGSEGGFVNFILKTGMWCIPYLFIPATFKFAGGALATIAGVTNDKSKGLFDRAKNKRAAKFKDFKNNKGYTIAGKQVPGMRRLGAGLGAGVRGRFGFGNRGDAVVDTNTATSADEIMRSAEWQQNGHDDNFARAASFADAASARAGVIADRMARGDSLAEATAAAEAAVAKVDSTVGFNRATQVAAAKQMLLNKTAYRDAADVAETIARVSNGSGNMARSLRGFNNATAKGVGRHDLSAISMETIEAAGSGAANVGELAHHDQVAGFRNMDTYQIGHENKQAMQNHVRTAQQEYEQALEAFRGDASEANRNRLVGARRNAEELMKNMGGATGVNSDLVTTMSGEISRIDDELRTHDLATATQVLGDGGVQGDAKGAVGYGGTARTAGYDPDVARRETDRRTQDQNDH